MNWLTLLQISILLFTMITENLAQANSNPFFIKQIKSVPRIGRRGRTSDDFENFFLKASKSVPRIGRRNYEMNGMFNPDFQDNYVHQEPQVVNKKAGNHFKEVPWAELAEMVEYYPEIMLMSPPMWPEGAFRDNYQFEDFGKRTGKISEQTGINSGTGQNSEIPVYRQQPIP